MWQDWTLVAEFVRTTSGGSLGLRRGSPGDEAQPHVPSVLQQQVDAVARLWATVELQWHVVLLACSHPLVDGSPA